MGLVHVLTGPDHLSAVATLACGNSYEAFWLGCRWGTGHSVGLFLVFLPLWMFLSSYQAIALLVLGGFGTVFWVLTTYADAKAQDAMQEAMAPLAGGGSGGNGGVEVTGDARADGGKEV